MSNKAKYFFIAGNPVFHSLSPKLYDAYADDCGLDHKYLKALCNCADDVRILLFNGFSGCNITSPLKEEVLKLNFPKSQSVIKTKASNIIFKEKNEYIFENTDVYGVSDALCKVMPDLKGQNVLVLGAGGAARAAVYSLLQKSCNITISNRTVETATHWAEVFNCKFHSLKSIDTLIQNADIIINTLPHNADLNLNISKKIIILDADYRKRPLEKLCIDSESVYIPGTEWLIYQALSSFLLFGKKTVNEEILRTALNKKTIPSMNNIILTGMMKSGKSSVGKILSEKTKRTFVDTDAIIESSEGKTISEIFAESGAYEFRSIESRIFAECIKNKNQVISTGGGLVVDENNRTLIKKHGLCVWLFATPKIISLRDSNSCRPLLDVLSDTNTDRIQTAERIFKSRFDAYAACADLVVPVDNYSIDEIVTDLIYDLKDLGNYRL